MKRVLRFLAGLYPAWWRRRYGKELEALLEDSGSGWRDVWDLFRAAMEVQMRTWSFGRIVTVCGIAGVMLAGAVAFSMPYKYRSAATLKMDQPDSEGFLRVAEAAFTPQALSDIIRREHLYANAPPEDSIDRLRRGIRVEPVAPSLAQVSFAYEDPVQAQRVSQDLVDRIIEANLYVSSRGVNALQLVAPADQAKRQVEKKRYALAGFGLPTGMLLGVVLALILRPRATAAG